MSLPRHTANLLERKGVAWIALGINLLITFALWYYSSHEFAHRAEDRFAYRAEKQEFLLMQRMNDYEQVLRGAAGLFEASDWVDRGEWHRYIASLDLDKSLPGIQGTGFSLIVAPADKAAHEAKIRAEGFPQYAIRPEGVRETYSSIIYLEPFEDRNLRAFGYDMFSEPVRREAMVRARDTGLPALTGTVKLVQETEVDVQPGFLIYVPVYRNGQPQATVSERRAALLGFAYSPFRARDLMARVFDDPNKDVEIELYDGLPAPGRLLYRSEEGSRSPRFSVDLPISIGGHLWTGRFRSSARFEALVSSAQPIIILLAGLAISLMTFALLYLHARHSHELEGLVRSRTRELELARDEAESANRAKTVFLATVSHELRTPLNPIIGFSSLMLEDPDIQLPEAERRQIGIIRRCGGQLLEIIDEILDISSIESGHIAVDITRVPLLGVLQEQCDALQPLAAEAHLELRAVHGDESLVVMADEKRLRQVVRNLVANAIKFTDTGHVSVRAFVLGTHARIEVEDSGIGISAEDQAMLFQRFHRITDQTRRVRSGTGLGLAICLRLVEAMFGTIGVESGSGRGSRFWFTLPLAPKDG